MLRSTVPNITALSPSSVFSCKPVEKAAETWEEDVNVVVVDDVVVVLESGKQFLHSVKLELLCLNFEL